MNLMRGLEAEPLDDREAHSGLDIVTGMWQRYITVQFLCIVCLSPFVVIVTSDRCASVI